jgi:hypothetical protein
MTDWVAPVCGVVSIAIASWVAISNSRNEHAVKMQTLAQNQELELLRAKVRADEEQKARDVVQLAADRERAKEREEAKERLRTSQNETIAANLKLTLVNQTQTHQKIDTILSQGNSRLRAALAVTAATTRAHFLDKPDRPELKAIAEDAEKALAEHDAADADAKNKATVAAETAANQKDAMDTRMDIIAAHQAEKAGKAREEPPC